MSCIQQNVKEILYGAWWHRSVTPSFQETEEGWELEASLGYTVRL